MWIENVFPGHWRLTRGNTSESSTDYFTNISHRRTDWHWCKRILAGVHLYSKFTVYQSSVHIIIIHIDGHESKPTICIF